MSRQYFLRVFLQINILSAIGTTPFVLHAQDTSPTLQQTLPQPTARQLSSTGSAIALPPVPKPASHPHPPAPSADHLGAIFDTESISSLLNRNNDALRRSDLTAGYYVPAEAFGHIAPQLSPYRNWLAERGFSFEFSYKGEAMANVGGGISKGMSYAHELTFNTRWDLGRLLGLDGWILHAVMMERAGRQVSYDHVGDHHILLSEVYSLSGHAAAHLADIYLEKAFFNNRLNINIGRITLTHTYATSVLLCTFMVQCSAPPAIKADEGWSVYPKATWGGTLRFKPTRDLTLRTGVYRVGALTENPSGWAWGSERSTGVMLPIELTWEPFIGPDNLPGHYKLGFAHDTSPYADRLGTIPAMFAKEVFHDANKPRDTFYIEADQMVYRKGGQHQMAGGYILAGYVHNTPSVSTFSDQVYVGASLLGIIPRRPFDRFGVMYSYYQMSPAITLGQRLRQLAGMSMGAFVNGPQTHSAILEAYYGVPIRPGLVVQPEFEYMMRPGQTSVIPNATLVGLKVLGNL